MRTTVIPKGWPFSQDPPLYLSLGDVCGGHARGSLSQEQTQSCSWRRMPNCCDRGSLWGKAGERKSQCSPCSLLHCLN